MRAKAQTAMVSRIRGRIQIAPLNGNEVQLYESDQLSTEGGRVEMTDVSEWNDEISLSLFRVMVLVKIFSLRPWVELITRGLSPYYTNDGTEKGYCRERRQWSEVKASWYDREGQEWESERHTWKPKQNCTVIRAWKSVALHYSQIWPSLLQVNQLARGWDKERDGIKMRWTSLVWKIIHYKDRQKRREITKRRGKHEG